MALRDSRLFTSFLALPPVEWLVDQFRELLINSLKQGPVPRHIAFVMDGNRRYARSHRIEKIEGHNLGFEALARILEVCYKAGVKVVTIYAFSIENFKRSKYEVDALMEMAKLKLSQLAQHGGLLDSYGASVRVLGRRELLKADVLEAMARVVDATAHNTDAVLNICFPYTARDEIATAIRDTVVDYSTPLDRSVLLRPPRRASSFSQDHIAQHIMRENGSGNGNGSVKAADEARPASSSNNSAVTVAATTAEPLPPQPGSQPLTPASEISSDTAATLVNSTSGNSHPTPPAKVELDDAFVGYPPNTDQLIFHSPETITARTLDEHMFTAGCPPLDLLVRTSGVERLSDFLLWQTHQHTEVVFLDVLWPNFDLWRFLPVLWEWQWRVRKQGKLRNDDGGGSSGGGSSSVRGRRYEDEFRVRDASYRVPPARALKKQHAAALAADVAGGKKQKAS
ncbi:cis-prenyltransferase [Ascosphaera acerosa]|nr:cis-prenyltransferase [Ascosphaera acerosa]